MKKKKKRKTRLLESSNTHYYQNAFGQISEEEKSHATPRKIHPIIPGKNKGKKEEKKIKDKIK